MPCVRAPRIYNAIEKFALATVQTGAAVLSILIALLCPLTLTEAHTWAAAVLVDELDACGFSCASNCQVISVDHRHTHTTKSHLQYHAADSGRNEM